MNIQQKYNISTFAKLQLNYWGIAKCGNTTVKYILLRASNPELFKRFDKDTVNMYNKRHQGWVHQKCIYITPKEAKLNNFKNFTVLRDPVQRVYSMYSNGLIRPERVAASGSEKFKKDARKMFVNYKPSMFEFLDLLEHYPDQDRNIHYRSQKSFCLFDDIIKLDIERLSSTIHKIHPSLIAVCLSF